MKCSGCGNDVVAKAVFCHHCGARLDMPHGIDPDEVNGAGNSFDAPAQQPAEAADVPADRPAESTVEPSGGVAAGGASPTQSNAQRLREAMGANTDVVETDLWEGGYSAKAMMGNWILGGLLSACFLGLGIFLWSKGWSSPFVWWGILIALVALWGYLFILLLRRRLGVHYRLSTQRFFHEEGILRHKTDLIEVIDMDDITFEQTLIDRAVGVGSIHIVSSDRSHPELTIDGIEHVKDVAAKMHDARHTERLRRGLHIEQI